MTLAVTLALLLVTLAGIAYLLAANRQLDRFSFSNDDLGAPSNPARPVLQEAPSITVLKPLRGLEPQLYENLASFCAQRYLDYDVVFCLHAADDPALAVVERVARAHPECRTRIAFGHNPKHTNPKIANLAKPGAEIRGEIVLVSDSDIAAGPGYLRAIAATFANPLVGAVTTLYGAMPNDTPASQLGAMHVEEEFAPSVLVALALGKLRFTLGATMAVRHDVLKRIGGLEALGNRIADDHALGELVSKAGHEVALAPYVVRTTIAETRLRELWSHELRWARINRALAPAGYLFSFTMYATPFAVLYLAATLASAASPRDAAFAVLAGLLCGWSIALRSRLHRRARARFGAGRVGGAWYLILVRDLLSLAIWFASFFGRTVRWRSATFIARR